MISDRSFDLNSFPLKGAVAELNEELAALGIAPGEMDDGQTSLYGEGVYGVRFGGNTRLGALVDGVSRVMWPEDKPAVAPHTANKRDHLIVCANYPDQRTEALQFFTTFQPGQSPWIQYENGELRHISTEAVNIDSSAKLQLPERLPPGYNSPVSAYLINLFWLVEMEKNSKAVIEVNVAMEHSLERWGIELGEISDAEPRKIDEVLYKRLIIDPSLASNEAIVGVVRDCPPTTFRITEQGLAIADNNRSTVAA